MHKGKLDEAITCYKKAINLDPRYVSAYSNLGRALLDRGKPDQAIAVLRKAIVHQLIDRQVTDVLETSAGILATARDMSAQEIRRSAIRITGTRELGEQKRELEPIMRQKRHNLMLKHRGGEIVEAAQ